MTRTPRLAVLLLLLGCSTGRVPPGMGPGAPDNKPTAPPAPKPASAPAPAAAPTGAETSDGPTIDCKRFPEEPAPSRRWLCDLAMAKSPRALVDAQGFALVTEFEVAGEDLDPGAADEGHLRKRVCGAEAEERARGLASTIRYTFSLEDPADRTDQRVTCSKMRCELYGMGEYSTNLSLTFRSTPAGPVLDSWAEIEVVLVSEAEVERRAESLAKGLRELAKTTCKP